MILEPRRPTPRHLALVASLMLAATLPLSAREPTAGGPTTPPTTPPTAAPAWVTGLPGEVALALSDDFVGTALDRSKWCTRYQHAGGPALQMPDKACTRPADYGTLDFLNDEQQRYVDVNRAGQALHRVAGGVLQLVATASLPGPKVLFESAMIRSKREFRPDANRDVVVVARVRLPDARGSWPAIWISPGVEASGHTAWPPEIDIMEGALNASSDPREKISMGSRPQNWGGEGMGRMPVPLTYAGPGFDRGTKRYTRRPTLRGLWLEIGAHWTESSVCYYVDQVKTACEDYRWLDNQRRLAPPGPLLLNLAVGGQWAGADGIDLPAFPASFDVDFVRVYEVRRR